MGDTNCSVVAEGISFKSSDESVEVRFETGRWESLLDLPLRMKDAFDRVVKDCSGDEPGSLFIFASVAMPYSDGKTEFPDKSFYSMLWKKIGEAAESAGFIVEGAQQLSPRSLLPKMDSAYQSPNKTYKANVPGVDGESALEDALAAMGMSGSYGLRIENASANKDEMTFDGYRAFQYRFEDFRKEVGAAFNAALRLGREGVPEEARARLLADADVSDVDIDVDAVLTEEMSGRLAGELDRVTAAVSP